MGDRFRARVGLTEQVNGSAVSYFALGTVSGPTTIKLEDLTSNSAGLEVYWHEEDATFFGINPLLQSVPQARGSADETIRGNVMWSGVIPPTAQAYLVVRGQDPSVTSPFRNTSYESFILTLERGEEVEP